MGTSVRKSHLAARVKKHELAPREAAVTAAAEEPRLEPPPVLRRRRRVVRRRDEEDRVRVARSLDAQRARERIRLEHDDVVDASSCDSQCAVASLASAPTPAWPTSASRDALSATRATQCLDSAWCTAAQNSSSASAAPSLTGTTATVLGADVDALEGSPPEGPAVDE